MRGEEGGGIGEEDEEENDERGRWRGNGGGWMRRKQSEHTCIHSSPSAMGRHGCVPCRRGWGRASSTHEIWFS